MHPIRLYSAPCPDEADEDVARRVLEAEERYRPPTVWRPGKLFYSLDMGGLDDADAQLEAHRIREAVTLAVRRRGR